MKANNELYKTITIDIDRIDRNLTTLEVSSIRECTTSTSTDVEQLMNEQDISTDENITEQINKPKNEKPVINETSKKAQQEEQQEEIDDPSNEHRAATNETVYKQLYQTIQLQLIKRMYPQDKKYTVLHLEKINIQFHL